MRAFSGIQPSGDLHIGNYFGAVQQWVKLQQEVEALYCVVDLHAITVPQDPALLRRRTLEIAAIYVACGIDPIKNILFVQSAVPQHTELAWIFNNVVKMSELSRMTQYKDKSLRQGENPYVGLFTYPLLMAADILLYDTAVVPVGHDQVQHVELAADIANRFNKTYGETFVVPKPKLQAVGARVMSLDEPTRKMSKSDKNTVLLLDPPEVVRKKVMRAMTDSEGTVKYDKARPGIFNLIEIFSLATGKSPLDIEAEFAGKGYGDFKSALADALLAVLDPIREKAMGLLQDEIYLRDLLAEGARRAETLAAVKLRQVKERVGFLG